MACAPRLHEGPLPVTVDPVSGPGQRLPDYLAPLFWDVELSSVDPERHRAMVIERALELGDDRAIAWLVRSYPATTIAEVVRSSLCISRNTANLWSIVLGIPREEIRCFLRRSLLPQGSFSNG